MNLKKLSRDELDQRFRSFAQKERDLLYEILQTLKEIDSRRLYLELGFPSLFAYLTEGIGYSEGSAQRRIDAARLLKEMPEVAERLRTGDLKLTQVALVQRAEREARRNELTLVAGKPTIYSVVDKRRLLDSLQNKNHRESQQKVAAFFDLPPISETRVRAQADSSIRVELTLTQEQADVVRQAQELESHSLSSQDLAEFLIYVSRRIVRQKAGMRNSGSAPIPAAARKTSPAETDGGLDKNSSDSKSKDSATVAAKSVSRALRKEILAEASCTYVDGNTGRQCGSKWKLQTDHRTSQWAGGSNDPENLDALCGPHNRLKYRFESGLRWI